MAPQGLAAPFSHIESSAEARPDGSSGAISWHFIQFCLRRFSAYCHLPLQCRGL